MPVFKAKDGIDNVSVTFDRPSPAFYTAGETLAGKIVVNCADTTPVRGIKIKIFGRMNIYWKKVEGGATVEFAEIEDYLDESLTVWIPNPRRKEDQWLFAGTHEYPFEYALPVDLPETLEDSRYATINYTIKATIYMTLGRTSASLEEPFYLIALPDPAVPKPDNQDMPKENCTYATIAGSCFSGKTHVELYMRLEKNVYKLGETIPVHLECTVKGGSADVDKVNVLLVQEAIYTCNMGSKDEVRKKERLVVAEDEDKEDADPGECQNYDLKLEIEDKLPLTDFPWCDFIKMGYFVHAVARTHSVYDDIVVKLPIVIEPKDEHSGLIVMPEQVVIENDEKEQEEQEVDKDIEEEEGAMGDKVEE